MRSGDVVVSRKVAAKSMLATRAENITRTQSTISREFFFFDALSVPVIPCEIHRKSD